jgi:hypothetical protein
LIRLADKGSTPRRSATDGEADQESDHKRHAETRRVDEWNEARSGLVDLEGPRTAADPAPKVGDAIARGRLLDC